MVFVIAQDGNKVETFDVSDSDRMQSLDIRDV